MEYNKRGRIQYRDRAQQIIDFSGLRYGNITPTDVDGIIEYKNKAYILYEMKYGSADMPDGQRMAIERQIDDFTNSGKTAVALLCEHDIQNCNEDIDAAKTIVRKYYYNKKWYNDGKRTAKDVSDKFIYFVDNFHITRI